MIRWAGLAIGLGGVAVLVCASANGDTLPVIEVLLTALGYSIGPLIANRKLATCRRSRSIRSAWARPRSSTPRSPR